LLKGSCSLRSSSRSKPRLVRFGGRGGLQCPLRLHAFESHQPMFAPIFLADLSETARNVGETFGFNSWAFVAQALSFSLVCGALYKFAYHPILKVLEDRRVQIERTQQDAAAMKVHLADAERKASELVMQASSGAQKMVEEAKAAAQDFSDKQLREAKAEAEAIVAKAREEARRDYDRMLGELRGEVARLVVETTSKVLGRVLTAEDQARLSEAATRELAA
jgi:F-type H+-transporting ATPase subunit b